MNKFCLRNGARIAAEVLREDYGVPVHKASLLQAAAYGAGKQLEEENIEVQGFYVTGAELDGIIVVTFQSKITIQHQARRHNERRRDP